MRRLPVIALLTNAFCVAVLCADDTGDAITLPVKCTEKVEQMPDLCQTDEAFQSLPHQGKYWCCPTAFANVLIAMDRRGCENLVSGDVISKEHQRALLQELGAKEYLYTTKEGTGPLSAMKGIRRFMQERGYEACVQWKGWRRGGEFSSGQLVELNWLRQGVLGESNVLMNVGWYQHDETGSVYQRIGGHYMTLVGYKTEQDQTTYLVQDPSPRSGPGKVTHEVRLVPIEAGELAPWKSYGTRSAAGHFLMEGIVLKSTADVAILDGAIRVTISRRQ